MGSTASEHTAESTQHHSPLELRGYQEEMIEAARRAIAQHTSLMLQAPTGSGKTAIAAAIIQSATDKGREVGMLAPRRELVYQASGALTRCGVGHGVVMAGESHQWAGRAFAACIPTLHARYVRKNMRPPMDPSLLIVDEAHLSVAPSVRAVLDLWPKAKIIGLSATPARMDGRALGDLYDDLIKGPSVAELTRMGFLVPARYYAPSTWDLSEVRVARGDYVQQGLDRVVSQPKLVGDVVANWARICPDRQTVVFAASVRHSLALCQRFREAGYTAEHLDANTDVETRAEILDRFAKGETQILTNCQLLTYGWDAPAAACAVLARPTKSVVAYLQMIGRILRPCGNKQDCIVIDHGGMTHELGFAHDEREWSLNGKRKQGARIVRRDRPVPREFDCEACGRVFSGQPECPECGHPLPEKKGRDLWVREAELDELDPNTRRAKPKAEPSKSAWLAEFKGYARAKGYAPGWAFYAFRQKFKAPPHPNYVHVEPVAPSEEVCRYGTYLRIRAAKSAQRAA